MGRENTLPRAPTGLGTPGRKLWREILSDLDESWELDRRELHLLARAARCADEIALLEATVDRDGPTTTGASGQVCVHPALIESRQLSVTQMRLLGAIELSDPAERRRSATPAVAPARRAAESRWGHRGGGRGSPA
jgi:P27 family predicted phage terminase small subunit